MFVLLISSSVPLVSQCPYSKVVGSAVGIHTLSQAINSGTLVLNSSGQVISDFCVNGTFELNMEKEFFGINVLVFSASTLRKSTLNDNVVFRNSFVAGQSNAVIEVKNGTNGYGSGLVFVNSTVQTFYQIRANNAGAILTKESNFINNGTILIENAGLIWNMASSFVSSQITARLAGAVISHQATSYTTNCTTNSTNCYAIVLTAGGHFYGKGNQNLTSFAGILCDGCSALKESGSTFSNCKNGIYFNNATPENEVNANLFTGQGPLFPTVGVRAVNSYNLLFSDNIFNHTDNASSAFNFQNGGDNVFTQNASYTKGLNYVGYEDNDVISFNSEINSIYKFVCSNSSVVGNHFNNPFAYDLKIERCNNVLTYYNYFSSQATGVELKGGGFDNTLRCNSFYTPLTGLSIESKFQQSSYAGLDLFDNQFYDSQTGMEIKESIPVQLDKGNDFFNCTLGVNYTGPSLNNKPLFRVRIVPPSEYPYCYPQNLLTTNNALPPVGECNIYPQYIDPNPSYRNSTEDLDFKSKLIISYLECYNPSQSVSGKCHGNIKKAQELINLYPVLLDNKQIYDLYQSVNETDLIKLPLFCDVRKYIRSKYISIKYLPDFNSLPSNDQITEVFNNIALKKMFDDLSDAEKQGKIQNVFNTIEEVVITNPTSSKYKMALKWYLDYQSGISLTTQRKNEIIELLEDCGEIGSPAHEVALYLCSAYDLKLTNPEICSELRNVTISENVRLTPNPASEYLNLTGINSNEVLIIDILGNPVYGWAIVNDQTINVSRILGGIYVLKVKNQNIAIKFIKI